MKKKCRDTHRRPINGLLLLDKPTGMSSNEALQEVKGLYYARKAGHTGSLDPLATGMLPICFGESTKFSQFLLESDKRYEVCAQLGSRTTTSDSEGEVVEQHVVPNFLEQQLIDGLNTFFGETSQIPSMYSAIKYKGEPLYKLARQGITVPREPRNISVYSINFLKYDADKHQLFFDLHCSKGTYVRTIVDDLGQQLGCSAHVTALRRTTVSHFQAEQMIPLQKLRELRDAKAFQAMDDMLFSMTEVLQQWPLLELNSATAFYLKQGNPVMVPHAPTEGWVRLGLKDGTFIGVGEVLDNGMVAPRRIQATS
jgi:tRNA pseudouridine55 synthase